MLSKQPRMSPSRTHCAESRLASALKQCSMASAVDLPGAAVPCRCMRTAAMRITMSPFITAAGNQCARHPSRSTSEVTSPQQSRGLSIRGPLKAAEGQLPQLSASRLPSLPGLPMRAPHASDSSLGAITQYQHLCSPFSRLPLDSRKNLGGTQSLESKISWPAGSLRKKTLSIQ